MTLILTFSVSGWANDQKPSDSKMNTKTINENPAINATDIKSKTPEHGIGHKLLFYFPNRILDIFDIARLRLRVGPGLSFGARLTEPLSIVIGGHESVFVGLPGPRLAPVVKFPAGIENESGLGIHFFDGNNLDKNTPDYSFSEIGYSLHALIIGGDVDVDPMEIADLIAGLVLFDLRNDDL